MGNTEKNQNQNRTEAEREAAQNTDFQIAEELIRQMEAWDADTEEMWPGKYDVTEGGLRETACEKSIERKEERRGSSRVRRIGVVGIDEGAGAGFLFRRLFLACHKAGLGHLVEIFNLGKEKSPLAQMDFIFVAADGRTLKKAGSSAEKEIASLLRRMEKSNIPFQLVINRMPFGRCEVLDPYDPVYFPVMEMDPAEQLMMRLSVIM